MLRVPCHEPETPRGRRVTRSVVATGEPLGMILVGARFRALAGARAALRAVRNSVDVPAGDVGVRPLGSTGYESSAEAFVLAGRFAPDDVATVIRILHTHGGRIVVRRIDSPGAVSVEPARRAPGRDGMATAGCRPPVAHQMAPRVRSAVGGRPRKRLRRPSPPLRVRTARCHRIER